MVSISLSGDYEVMREKCADLPCPLKRASVALHDNKVYAVSRLGVIDTPCYVYVYDINDNKWATLYPSPKQFYGTLQIINSKLTIIGGIIATGNTRENYKWKRTNRVTTYNAANQSWINEYPSLQKAREMPGVLTHLNYVIVAGGRLCDGTFSSDIEFLDYKQPSPEWMMANMKLPVEMSHPSLTITGNTLYIVGFDKENADKGKIMISHNAFKVSLSEAQFTENQKAQWTKIPSTPFGCTALIPNFSPPVIVGGITKDVPTDDIRVLHEPNKSWKKIASLGFPRFDTAVVPINHESILVIGGSIENTKDEVGINTVEKVTIRQCHTQL